MAKMQPPVVTWRGRCLRQRPGQRWGARPGTLCWGSPGPPPRQRHTSGAREACGAPRSFPTLTLASALHHLVTSLVLQAQWGGPLPCKAGIRLPAARGASGLRSAPPGPSPTPGRERHLSCGAGSPEPRVCYLICSHRLVGLMTVCRIVILCPSLAPKTVSYF